MTKSSKASLLIIFLTVFIDLLGFGIVLPLLPRYGRYFDASGPTLGLLMASFSAMQFLFAPLWGRLSDRVGRRPVLMVGLAGSTVCYALFGVATNLGCDGQMLGLGVMPWLFITRIGAGIAGATIPTAQAYIADTTDESNRGKGMALIGMAFGCGFTFGPLLGAGFVSADIGGAPSGMPGFVASGLSGLALMMAIFKLPESLNPDTQQPERNCFNFAAFGKALSQPSIGRILFAMFLTTFAFAKFESTLSLLTHELGLAARYNFYIFAYLGLVLSIAQGGLVRRLLPKVGEYRMSIAGAALMAVGLVLIGVVGGMKENSTTVVSNNEVEAPTAESPENTDSNGNSAAGSCGSHLVNSGRVATPLPQTDTKLIIALCLVLPVGVVGFSALSPSLQAMLSLRTPDDQQGGILGVGQSMLSLARILGPIAGMSLFSPDTVEHPYWVAGGLMVLGLLLVSTLKDNKNSGNSGDDTTDGDGAESPQPAVD